MKTNPSADVFPLLRQLRRRWLVRGFLHAFAVSSLYAAAALLVLAAILHFVRPGEVMSPSWLVSFFAVALLAAVGWLVLRYPSLATIAQATDRLGETRDRLLTALSLANHPAERTTLERLAEVECMRYLATRDFRPLIPLAPPAWMSWLLVPLAALALLQWHALGVRAAFQAGHDEAQRAIAGTTRQIEEMAARAQKAADEAKSGDFRKLAEQLQQSVERLKAERNVEDAQKAAMRELSALEQAMRELQRQPSPVDEMKEFTKALTSLAGMEDVLNALNEDDLAEAQRAMERAMAKQNEQAPDQLSEEQVQKQLQQAIERMKDQRRLSEALQKFSEQMKKQMAGGGMTQQAMKQLQQMMQQMSQGQRGDADSGSNQRQMTLQEMIAALENMKFGEGQADQGSESSKVPNGNQVSVLSFGSANPQGNPQLGNAGMPSGRPGSEKDFGTTDTPFGAKSDPQEKGGELALKGQLGQGDTLSMMLPSNRDNSKAARRYKDLYEAAAAQAQDAVEQEDIPLGSRFLVRRYFEMIRPTE